VSVFIYSIVVNNFSALFLKISKKVIKFGFPAKNKTIVLTVNAITPTMRRKRK
jgi:hypothetical protein